MGPGRFRRKGAPGDVARMKRSEIRGFRDEGPAFRSAPCGLLSVLPPPLFLPMRRNCRLAIVLLLFPLSGCLGSVDSEQVRVCRQVLPALHPDGTDLREIAVAPAALGRQGVRIDYDAREPGEPTRRRFATCGFGGSVFSSRRFDLV